VARLVCVKCEVELRPEKNGVVVPVMFMENTKVYEIYRADKWMCPKCGYEVVAGFGKLPMAEHFKDKCEEIVKQMKENDAVVIYDKEVCG